MSGGNFITKFSNILLFQLLNLEYQSFKRFRRLEIGVSLFPQLFNKYLEYGLKEFQTLMEAKVKEKDSILIWQKGV
jgi:hypothetical protein